MGLISESRLLRYNQSFHRKPVGSGELCVETVEKVPLDKFGALCAKSDFVESLTINDFRVGRGQMAHEKG